MYLDKSQNVIVPITKIKNYKIYSVINCQGWAQEEKNVLWIAVARLRKLFKYFCPNHKMYLEKLQNLFGQITKCIWTNCKMSLYQFKKSKLWNVLGQGWAQEENSCCARKGNSAQCIKIKMQRAKIISLHFHWNSRKYIAVTSVQWVQCIYGSALEFHVAYIRQCIQLIVKYCDAAMTVHCINSQ